MEDSSNLFVRTSSFDYEKSQEEKSFVKADANKYKPKSRFRFILRIILVAGLFILIPLEATGDKQLYEMEKKKLFKHFESIVSSERLRTSQMHGFFTFLEVFIHKDFFMAINIILYNIFHPVLTLKIIYTSTLSFYILVLLRCIYQGKSPSWELNEQGIIHCTSSFSIPSSSLYLYIFYFIYSFVNYKNVYHPRVKGKQDYRFDYILKLFLFVLFAVILIVEIIFMLFYKVHYLVDMIYTLCLGIFAVSVATDFDENIQSYTYTRLKTVFKVRKNKIKIFLYTFGFTILGIIINNFVTQKGDIIKFYEQLALSDQCTRIQREELGLKSTFADIPYIFCYLGAFWGISLPIEQGVNVWWIPRKNHRHALKIEKKFVYKLIGRVILSLVFGGGLWAAFHAIPNITYEFNFGINCVKYFCIYFFCLGVLPLLFRKIGLISRDDDALQEGGKNKLFKYSVFSESEAPIGKLMPDDSGIENKEQILVKGKIKETNIIKCETDLNESDDVDLLKDDLKFNKGENNIINEEINK